VNELTEKELFIAMLVADGLRNPDIAVIIGTSEHVVKNKLKMIYDKLGFWNRTELALWYVKREHDREKVELKAKAQKGGS